MMTYSPPPDALELPAYLDGAPIAARVERGARCLTWTLRGPGDLYRNHYRDARLDVTERPPFHPDGLVTLRRATRLVGPTYDRLDWTEAGRRLLALDIVPPLVHYGFGRLWAQVHQAAADPRHALDRKAECQQQALWWDLKAVFTNLYKQGRINLRPIGGDLPRSQRVADNYRAHQGGFVHAEGRAEVFASCWYEGRRVAWMTTGGDIIPNDHILELER